MTLSGVSSVAELPARLCQQLRLDPLDLGARQTGDVTRTLAAAGTRALGAYYTPSLAARYMARWALPAGTARVLEPSMGDGSFLAAVREEANRRALRAECWGVELALDTFTAAVSEGLVERERAILSDFLAVPAFPVDVVIGNPPYVRLRHLPKTQAARALLIAETSMGRAMDPSGSVWMPFVLHATDFLAPGGKLALVLPYDLTYVRYARPLWNFLGEHFGDLRLVRVHERIFPDILQDVVLLFASGKGKLTDRVRFEAYASTRDLLVGKSVARSTIPISRITNGQRPFLEALLPPELQELLRGKLAASTVQARELASLNIGYVTGDKTFFHPSPQTIREFGIPASSLRPAATSGRSLRGVGVRSSGAGMPADDRLFLPPAEGGSLSAGELKYVESGHRAGVADRYKCRVRDPWYVTPGVRVPDLLIPVFTERPVVVINDARLVASNSLLCGYLRRGEATAFAQAWYTSLTLLQVELEVHALGGGVMVLVPQEAGNIRLPRVRSAQPAHLGRLDALIAKGSVAEAFRSGDRPVLQEQCHLSGTELELIQHGRDTLAWWRSKRSTQVLDRASLVA